MRFHLVMVVIVVLVSLSMHGMANAAPAATVPAAVPEEAAAPR